MSHSSEETIAVGNIPVNVIGSAIVPGKVDQITRSAYLTVIGF